MCGRYYINEETAREIEKAAGLADEIRRGPWAMGISPGEICPTDRAPVLAGKGGSLRCKWARWGFLSEPFRKNRRCGEPYQERESREKQVIFLARRETVMEKPLFRDSLCHDRVAVPAAWFYEWNVSREKNAFYRTDSTVLFMAGISRQYEDGEHFVSLTTGANASMSPVHDRMPLILEKGDLGPWIFDGGRTEEILEKPPCLLGRRCDYEQLSMF